MSSLSPRITLSLCACVSSSGSIGCLLPAPFNCYFSHLIRQASCTGAKDDYNNLKIIHLRHPTAVEHTTGALLTQIGALSFIVGALTGSDLILFFDDEDDDSRHTHTHTSNRLKNSHHQSRSAGNGQCKTPDSVCNSWLVGTF